MRIIQLGDIGTKFEATVKDQDGCLIPDLSTATKLEFVFKKPNGVSFRKTATYESTSLLTYVTTTGVLDVVGKWSGQGYVEMPGFTGRTSVFFFQVERNLD